MKTKRNRIKIMNCPIDNLTMDETLCIIKNSVASKKVIKHVVVNAAKLVYMRTDQSLFNAVTESDIINADGQAVVWASRLLGTPLIERVTGIDLMQNIVKVAYHENFKIYFLGAEQNVLEKVIERYASEYSSGIIAGYSNGFFSDEEEINIVKKIKDSKPDILFIAITSPKKEIFLEKYKNFLNIPFIMGVGGSFDVVGGKTKRAPIWMQKKGLEWFFRVLQEPRRMWKRYLTTNTIFIFEILKLKITGKE